MKKKVNSKNNIPKFSTGGATASGALTGATTGLAIGANPLLMGATAGLSAPIGAAVGAIGGGIYGNAQGKKAEAQAAKDLATQQGVVAQNNFNANYKPQFASGYYSMATGGIMPGTNAMVDNNEVVQTNGPINQLAQSNGGGQLEQTSNNTAVVNGSNPNQTDGVQAQIEPGSRIFSDKIKSPNGKTYAELADRISKGKSRYEKLLEQDDSSQLQKKTAEKMIEKIDAELDELFQEQEATKPQPIEQPQSIQQGKPVMANGGIVPGYYNGGYTTDDPDGAPYMQPNMMQTNPIGPPPEWTGMPKPINPTINTDYSIPAGPTSTEPNQPNTPASRAGYKRDLYGNEYKVNKLGLSDWQTSQGALRGLGMAGPAINVGRGLFEKVDLLDPNAYGSNARITAPKMDVEPQIAEVRNASMANRKALGSMGSQAFLTGMNSVNANSDRSIAGIYANKHNIDAENQMKADMYNAEANKGDAENRLRIEMINRGAKGAKDQMLTGGLGQLSDIGYGMASERAYNKSAESVNSNYYLAPDGTRKVRSSSEKGNVGAEGYIYGDKSSTQSITPPVNTNVAEPKTFNPKEVTASIKAKDTEKFRDVYKRAGIKGGTEYDNYLKEKLKKIPNYGNLTWGQIKKYLD